MNRSVVISIVLAAAATLWILSGSLSTEDAQAKNESDTLRSAPSAADRDSLFKVRVKALESVSMTDLIDLQGDIHAARDIEIKAETQGRIETLWVQKGARLDKGQKILTITMNDRTARLEQAKAQLKVSEAELASGLKLMQKNLLSQNQHERNIANVEAARAAVKQIQVEIQYTRVAAAFGGILNELHVESGDYVTAGDPIAVLVDDSAIRIRAYLPQQYISRVKLGQKVVAELLDDTQIEGTVSYISSSANPQTRTFIIEAQANNTGQIMRFGQSARVKLMLEQRKAHKLSPSYLDLDSQGGLRVKSIDDNNRVMAHAVKIIRNEKDGVWLSGIPDSVTLITAGQGFVSQGDLVEPVFDDAPAEPTDDNLL